MMILSSLRTRTILNAAVHSKPRVRYQVSIVLNVDQAPRSVLVLGFDSFFPSRVELWLSNSSVLSLDVPLHHSSGVERRVNTSSDGNPSTSHYRSTFPTRFVCEPATLEGGWGPSSDITAMLPLNPVFLHIQLPLFHL